METYPLEQTDHDSLFENGLRIIKTLNEEGHTAYFAGGCVRDRYLGMQPEDYDIATDAPPGRVEDLFSHTIPVGKSFGVIIVVMEGEEFDVARFRQEANYEDGRRPSEVEFTSAEEDVKRRDFTINGLLWDPLEEKILDYVGGVRDIENSLLRTIGPPDERFSEDFLRMLRAPRFAAQLDFDIDTETEEAVRSNNEHIQHIAKERVLHEMKKLLTTRSPGRGVKKLHRLGLLNVLFPEVQKLDSYPHGNDEADQTILEHTIETLSSWAEEVRPSFPAPEPRRQEQIGFSLFLHDIARPEASDPASELPVEDLTSSSESLVRTIMQRLKASNKLTGGTERSVSRFRKVLSADQYELADRKRWLMDQTWPVIKHVCSSVLSADPSIPSEPFEQLLKLESELESESFPPDPLLDGHDLKELGLEPGPQFGELLERVRRAQLNEEIFTREEAIEMVKSEIN